jgi:hypothetical protein
MRADTGRTVELASGGVAAETATITVEIHDFDPLRASPADLMFVLSLVNLMDGYEKNREALQRTTK